MYTKLRQNYCILKIFKRWELTNQTRNTNEVFCGPDDLTNQTRNTNEVFRGPDDKSYNNNSTCLNNPN